MHSTEEEENKSLPKKKGTKFDLLNMITTDTTLIFD